MVQKGLFVMNKLSFLKCVGVGGSADGISALNATLVASGFGSMWFHSLLSDAAFPNILVLSPKAEQRNGQKQGLWNQTAWI